MNLTISNLKIDFKKVLSIAKNNIIILWSVLGVILLIWAGYIFYFKSYAPTYAAIAPIVRPQTVQKNKLEAILKDLSAREQAINEFAREKITNPFEFRLTP